jgi:transcriptional regulator with XRE-family HTH domain
MTQQVESKAILNCLRKYRKARGLKQSEVAKLMGLQSASKVSHWENGVSVPSTVNVMKLAALYRVMVESLFPDLIRQYRAELAERETRFLARPVDPPPSSNE